MIYPFDYPEIDKLFGDLLKSLFDESGRGALLIVTAHVDEKLTDLIIAAMPNEISKKHKERLFKYPGPISSLSSKIELSYVFRLIDKKVYDSLNTLRKLRNDAAHSPLKFELHELSEKLKSIYNIGPGFSNFINEISHKAVIQTKMERVKKILEDADMDDTKKQNLFNDIFEKGETKIIIEKQVPFMELAYGLSFICGLLVFYRLNVEKVLGNIKILSDLTQDEPDDEKEQRTANKV